MADFAVIIPSKLVSNLAPCLAQLYACEPVADVIVIDDNLERRPSGPTYVPGNPDKFIFSRAINQGIEAAGAKDVVIMGDDVLLKTPDGLSSLSDQSANHPEYGLISSSCNMTGNTNQWPRGDREIRPEPRMVCFICVYIPRKTIDTVGLLDETFDCYSHQDDDIFVRVRKAGLKIGIWDGCFADHGSLQSTFRGPAGRGGDLTEGDRIFRAKWGCGNHEI